MSNVTLSPDFTWASLLNGEDFHADEIPLLEEFPQQERKRLCAALRLAARCGGGDIVISQLGVQAAAAAAVGAGPGGRIFFVHSDLRVVRDAFQALSQKDLEHPILFFHGRTRDFAREVPIRPLIAAVRGGDDVLEFWHDLPKNTLLIVADSFPAERKWEEGGFLERLPNGEQPGLFRTTSRFSAIPSSFPERLFRQMRADLLARYFGLTLENDSSYTPVAEYTEDARRWWLDETTHGAGGYESWPYRNVSTALPESLPNGERWPLISIVTPSYNQGKYLEETLLSVQNQNYPRLEHIVMDGGSKDETKSILARYRSQLSAAVSEKDRGQAHAINKGMALANGDILTWLNSDDMLAPGALGAIAMGFHLSKADVVAGIVYLRSGNRFVDSHMTSCPAGPLPLDRILDLDGGWNAGQFFYQPEVMFSRGAWERAGGQVREDLYYSMDYDLWVRMAETGARLHAIGRPTAWFRVHEEQKTSVAEKFMAELRGYVEDYNRRHERTPPPSPVRQPDRRHLRILMLNDHGYRFGAGIAHGRTADSLALAGHEIHSAAFLTEPGHHGKPSHLTSDDILQAVENVNPDLIITGNVHSATHEPWHMGALAAKYPTLCVLHDFWLLTGRCAYPKPCEKHLTGCDASCPTADKYPKLEPRLIADVWARKQKLLFGKSELALLGNSAWTCEEAKKILAITGGGRPSVPVAQFRLSFPTAQFLPRDRRTCRSQLGLPEDRFIVLLSGDLLDERKNTPLALEAVEQLHLPNVTVVSLGYVRPEEYFTIDVRRPGHIDDPQVLATYYAAADILVAPSSEETFGQVFIEAAACGTPVVGIRKSGMQEAVIDGVTGILVDEISAESLAAAILELYRKPRLREDMGAWARMYVENEWSQEASYYYMFQAWRQLGLLDRFQLQPKIAFRTERGATSDVQIIQRREGVTFGDFTMGEVEGPFPEYALSTFRWAYGPESKIKFYASEGGIFSLVIRYRNFHQGQQLSLRINGLPMGDYPLATAGMSQGRMICARVTINAGENELELGFTRWLDPMKEGRPLAIAITDVFLLPDAARPVS